MKQIIHFLKWFVILDFFTYIYLNFAHKHMQKYENLNCNEIHYTECIVCNHTVLSTLPLAQIQEILLTPRVPREWVSIFWGGNCRTQKHNSNNKNNSYKQQTDAEHLFCCLEKISKLRYIWASSIHKYPILIIIITLIAIMTISKW